jgi:hypothetical protein
VPGQAEDVIVVQAELADDGEADQPAQELGQQLEHLMPEFAHVSMVLQRWDLELEYQQRDDDREDRDQGPLSVCQVKEPAEGCLSFAPLAFPTANDTLNTPFGTLRAAHILKPRVLGYSGLNKEVLDLLYLLFITPALLIWVYDKKHNRLPLSVFGKSVVILVFVHGIEGLLLEGSGRLPNVNRIQPTSGLNPERVAATLISEIMCRRVYGPEVVEN